MIPFIYISMYFNFIPLSGSIPTLHQYFTPLISASKLIIRASIFNKHAILCHCRCIFVVVNNRVNDQDPPPPSKSTLKYRQSKITLDMYYLVTSALKLTPYILESRVVFYFITLMGFIIIILPEDELRLLNIITYRNHYLWHNNVVILFLNLCVYLL